MALPLWSIVVIALGGVAALAGAALLVAFFVTRRRLSSSSASAASSSESLLEKRDAVEFEKRGAVHAAANSWMVIVGAVLLIAGVVSLGVALGMGLSARSSVSAGATSRASTTGDSEGRIRFFNTLGPSMETEVAALKRNDATTKAFAARHWAGSLTYTPHFDSATPNYANRATFYRDVYAIYVDSEPAGWESMVLKSATGVKLFIPWVCDRPSSQGQFCQWAADFGSPAWRTYLIQKLHTGLDGRAYAGTFLDDMNLAWPPRTSDAAGNVLVPWDPRTNALMTATSFRRYFAELAEAIRREFPTHVIVHNAIPFVDWADPPFQDVNVRRQIVACDLVYNERGILDGGLTGGVGQWSVDRYLRYCDYAHSLGTGVLHGNNDGPYTARQREYALAGYLLVNDGRDLVFVESNTFMSNWWRGYDADLGAALGPRTTLANGVYTRRFACGAVFLNPPGGNSVTLNNPGMRNLDLQDASTVTIAGGQAAVLLSSCGGYASTDPGPLVPPRGAVTTTTTRATTSAATAATTTTSAATTRVTAAVTTTTTTSAATAATTTSATTRPATVKRGFAGFVSSTRLAGTSRMHQAWSSATQSVFFSDDPSAIVAVTLTGRGSVTQSTTGTTMLPNAQWTVVVTKLPIGTTSCRVTTAWPNCPFGVPASTGVPGTTGRVRCNNAPALADHIEPVFQVDCA